MATVDHLQIAKNIASVAPQQAIANALIAIAELLTPKPLEVDAYNSGHNTYLPEQM